MSVERDTGDSLILGGNELNTVGPATENARRRRDGGLVGQRTWGQKGQPSGT